MEPGPKILYAKSEAAEMLSWSMSSLDEARRRGLIKGLKRGQKIFFHRDELERFAKRQIDVIWGPKRKGADGKLHTVCFGSTRA